METLIKIIADITGENVNDISSDDLLVDDLDIKDSILLNNKKIESSLSYIMSNSFAFGGTDSVLILKKL
ncbi:hypothetical protein [Apilactobacillus kunkeei]|uniref:hypothetical protein n=1 Tax=Apilactobacillus kunkeei TaxID=148814 RepID=UPI0030E95832